MSRVCPYCGERADTPRCAPCDAPTIGAEIADRIEATLDRVSRAAGRAE